MFYIGNGVLVFGKRFQYTGRGVITRHRVFVYRMGC